MPLLSGPLAGFFALAFGLVVGSFLNVCIHRLPLGQSVVRPRSRCPHCEAPISWFDNIPIVSWLVLRGRCRRCGARISWRYPFVEALGGATVLSLWYFFGATTALAVAAPFALALIVLFFTDFDHQLLPDAVTLVGLVVGLGLAWVNPFLRQPTGWARLVAAIGGAALGAGLLWAVGAVYGKLRGVEAMGMGDVKMMAMVGAFTGPVGVMFTIFAASVAGAVVGLAMIPLGGRTLQDKLPFGCFLAPAALAALLVGQQAARAYFDLLVRV
jgi:leader peptidase (prepilin peptidase)/N-methyltransferase